MSGASGLLGQLLTKQLHAAGHNIVPLVRHKPSAGEQAVYWSIERNEIDSAALEGFDAVIHLAGENLVGERWSDDKKRAIMDSRKCGTELLANALARLSEKPAVFISASAVGIYGDTKDAWVDENSTPGTDFLSDVCKAWELATEPARKAGIRVVNARLSVVFAADGGALAKMLPLFRAGVGGKLGSGKQFMSWIDEADVCGAIQFLLEHPTFEGPVNLSAPDPVRNSEFTKTLGKVLGRPTFLPVPPFALYLAFGKDMVDATLLQGQRVRPARLLEAGYAFQYPTLRGSLVHLLMPPGKT